MKGIAAWIWIILSVILGILVITFSSTLIINQYDLTQKQLAIDNFQDFYTHVKNVCIQGGIGEVYYYKISVPENTRAIYVSNVSDQLPPDTVSVLITKSRTSVGNYLCLQFADENIPRCGKFACYANFTYIGTPSLQPTLQSLVARLTGQSPIYNFLMMVNKTDFYYLNVKGTQTIGSQTPQTLTSTTATISSSATTSTTTTKPRIV